MLTRWPVLMAEGDAAGGSGGDPGAGGSDPAPPSSPQQGTGADSGSLLDWRSLAEPEYREDPVLQKYTSASEALKALVHSQRELGGRVRLPQEGASEAEWNQFYDRMGRPKSAGEYVVEDPKTAEGEPLLAKEFHTRLLEAGHAAGLTPKQMQAMINFAGQTVTDSAQLQSGLQAMQKAEAEKELAQMFGASAPRILAQANMVFDMLARGRWGGDKAIEARNRWSKSELANDPYMIAVLSNIWDDLGEGRFVESDTGGPLMSAEALSTKKAELLQVAMDETKSRGEREAAQAQLKGIYDQLVRLQEAAARRPAYVTGR